VLQKFGTADKSGGLPVDSVNAVKDRAATSLGEKNSRTFQGHSSTFSRPISATFYCDAGIL